MNNKIESTIRNHVLQSRNSGYSSLLFSFNFKKQNWKDFKKLKSISLVLRDYFVKESNLHSFCWTIAAFRTSKRSVGMVGKMSCLQMSL